MNKILEAINGQIINELASAHLYLNMAGFCEDIGYVGFARWFNKQAQEEREHAERMFNYILERNERPVIGTVPEIKFTTKSPLNIFEQVMAHEEKVTGQIHALYELAEETRDHGACVFLHWFVREQDEELGMVQTVVDRLSLFGEEPSSLLLIDNELGNR